MGYPKIRYNDGAAHELPFQLPPTNKPYSWVVRQGADSIATDGTKQSVTWRRDEFVELTLQWLAPGDDIAAWDAFMRWALLGATFTYFPDGDIEDISFLCTLEAPNEWKPKFTNKSYSATLQFRKV